MQGYHTFFQKIRTIARDNVQIPALIVFKVLAMPVKYDDCLKGERNATWKDIGDPGQDSCQIIEEKVRVNDQFSERPIRADLGSKAARKLV